MKIIFILETIDYYGRGCQIFSREIETIYTNKEGRFKEDNFKIFRDSQQNTAFCSPFIFCGLLIFVILMQLQNVKIWFLVNGFKGMLSTALPKIKL